MSIPIKLNPIGFDTWFVKVTRAFNNSIGEPGKVRLDYIPGNDPILEVFVNLDVSLDAVGDLKAIAGNLVPSGVSVEWYWENGLPMDYGRAEWIETVLSDKDNAPYLNTGITPTGETSCKIRCMWTEPTYTTSHVVYWFRSYPLITDQNAYNFLSRSGSGAYLSYSYGSQDTPWWNNITQARNTWQTIETRKNTLWINGTLRKTFQLEYFTAPGPLYLLQGNGKIPLGRGCNRISEFKIWDDTGDQANYIPAFNSLGETGMYDTVLNTFKVRANTTASAQFTVGLTLQQVRDMKLNTPGSISSLSLSIPCEVYNDPEAWGVIEAAQQKGWTFTFYWRDVITYLTPQINDVVGSGNYTIAYDYHKRILDIAVNTDVSPVAFRQLQELLTQIVPSGITQTITWSDGMPADWTRAYFLESTGSQKIDTGRLWNSQDEISILYEPTASPNYNIFGAGTYRMAATSNSSEGVYFTLPGKYAFGQVNGMVKTNAYYSFTELRVNEHSKAINIAEFESTNNIIVYGNADGQYPAKMRLYNYEHKKAGGNNMSLIPALNSSGIPGMYDTVSKTFKTNDGTGQFAIGMTLDQVISLKLPPAPAEPANELTLSVPGEVMYRQDAQKALDAARVNGWVLTIQYREIETPEFQGYVVADYIEKPAGAHTYINTGLSQRLLGYFDYMNTKCNQNSDYRYLWGIWPMQSNGRGSIWVQNSDSKIWLYAITEVKCEINTRHDLVHVLCARRVGDSSSKTYVGLGVDGSWPVYTANQPIPDGVTATYRMFAYFSAERLYSARFTDIEHKDIASFIPAIDPDGNPCMFDFVRKQPFYNANGTNKFAFTIGLTKEQAESLVLGDKGNGLTIQVPEGTDLEVMQANNPNVTIIIQTIPATTN